jgi:hypothetical protein
MIGVTILTFAWVMLVMAFYASKEESYHKGVVMAHAYEPPQPERQGSFLAGRFPDKSEVRIEPRRDWSFVATGRWWLHVAAVTIVLVGCERIFG